MHLLRAYQVQVHQNWNQKNWFQTIFFELHPDPFGVNDPNLTCANSSDGIVQLETTQLLFSSAKLQGPHSGSPCLSMYWAGSEVLDRFHDGSLMSEDFGPHSWRMGSQFLL